MWASCEPVSDGTVISPAGAVAATAAYESGVGPPVIGKIPSGVEARLA